MAPVCPTNPAPPLGTVQWTSPSASAQSWASLLLSGAPLFATIYGVIDGMHVTARVENHLTNGVCAKAITFYKPIEAARVEVITSAPSDPSSGPSTLALAGFGLFVFSTAFGLSWAFLRGEAR